MSIPTFIAVALGGALGATGRYYVHRGVSLWHGGEAAWSTLSINAVGSFLLGIAAAALAGRSGTLPPFLMVGVLGAFTTFSTFSMDAVTLFRDRGAGAAGLYIGLSVTLAIGAFVLGTAAHKALS